MECIHSLSCSSGIYSPVDPSQEAQVYEILKREFPDLSITLSNKVINLSIHSNSLILLNKVLLMYDRLAIWDS